MDNDRGGLQHGPDGRFLPLNRACKVENCGKPHCNRGFCSTHLAAFKRGRIDEEGKLILQECERCHENFEGTRGNQRFCSECQPIQARERELRYYHDDPQKAIARTLRSYEKNREERTRRRAEMRQARGPKVTYRSLELFRADPLREQRFEIAEYVVCRECGAKRTKIWPKHVEKIHRMSFEEYKSKWSVDGKVPPGEAVLVWQRRRETRRSALLNLTSAKLAAAAHKPKGGAPRKENSEPVVFRQMVESCLPRFQQAMTLAKSGFRALRDKNYTDLEIDAVMHSRNASTAAIRWVCGRQKIEFQTGKNYFSKSGRDARIRTQ